MDKMEAKRCVFEIDRAYQYDIEPFQQIIVRIYSMKIPIITISGNGEIDRKFDFSEQEKEAITLAETLIAYRAKMAKEAIEPYLKWF